MEDINRLKIVLVEKKKTGKWLAEQLGKNPSTVSKWCSNVAQPDLATLIKIATLLEVDVQYLKEVLPQNKTHEQQERMLGNILSEMKENGLIVPEGRTWFLKS